MTEHITSDSIALRVTSQRGAPIDLTMSKKKPIRLDDLLIAAATNAKEEYRYRTSCRATPLGRQSADLQDEATFGHGRSDPELSHQLYVQAAGLFAPNDQSAQAASARHDMAESFKNRRMGIRVENLLRAEEIYREVLRSKQRERFASRAAKTRASLASCLRQLAQECYDPAREAVLVSESTSLIKEAIAISERRGESGWVEAISYLNTLGNLQLQQELHDSAISTFNRAESLCGRLRALIDVASQDYARVQIARLPEYKQLELRMFLDHIQRGNAMALVLLSSANARIKRDKDGDRASAKRLICSLVDTLPSELGARARLLLAGLYRREGDLARAKEVLRSVDNRYVPPDALPEIAREHERLGQPLMALQVLHQAIEQAIEERKDHIADYAADHLAVRAQIAAAVAARIYVKNGDPLNAFLTLERCAGFRYEESLRHFSWRPADRLTRGIWERRWEYANCAGFLESLASHCSYLPTESVVPFLQQVEARLANQQNVSSTSIRDPDSDQRLLRDQLRGTCLELAPIEALRRRAQEMYEMTIALDRAISVRDPQGYARWNRDSLPDSNPALLKILQEQPSSALFRFSLREDLLVVCVYIKDGYLTARARSLSLPHHLLKVLAKLRDNPLPTQVDYASLTTMLGSLDLSPVFPDEPMRRAVLMPSLWASFLPLAALGPSGKTLLDRFESVVCIQSIAGLTERQDAHPPRSGTLTAVPEQTYSGSTTDLHGVALAALLPDEKVLCAAAATKARVAAALSDADTFVIYSHGQHEGETGPYLELRDGKFDMSFGDRHHWIGLERAELWGCQSGVNLPHDPLTPQVDEGFGFDSILLSYGVRTAIGTLWKVSEIVTAYLVRSYRQELASGADAATALARAQRSWRDHGVVRLARSLQNATNPIEGVQSFLRDCEGGHGIVDASAAKLLGAAKSLQEAELAPFLAWFTCPATWGGYRFLGIPERRARRGWTDDDVRPLAAAEIEELRTIEENMRAAIVEQANAEPQPSTEQWIERDLKTAIALPQGSRPTPTQAFTVARSYAERLLTARDNNLLSGLSWLHEALQDAQIEPNWKARLSLEASHFWLELAEGELVAPGDLSRLREPHEEALARARRLLVGMPVDFEPADVAAAHARLAFLSHLRRDPPRHVGEWMSRELGINMVRQAVHANPAMEGDLHEMFQKQMMQLETAFDRAVRAAAPFLAQIASRPACQNYAHRRALAVACNIVRAAPHRVPVLVDKLLSQALELLNGAQDVPVEEHGSLGRMDLAQLDLRLLASPADLPVRRELGWLGTTDVARFCRIRQGLRSLYLSGRGSALPEDDIGYWLAILEKRIWGGHKSFDRQVFWHSTGTLGHAYRVLLGSWLGAQHPEGTGLCEAAHTIACLQLACDLRLPVLRRAIDFAFRPPMNKIVRFQELWRLPLWREKLICALRDAALQQGSAAHRDPFEHGAQQLYHGEQPRDFTGQILAMAVECMNADKEARTTSFMVTRLIEGISERLDKTWNELLNSDKELANGVPRDPELAIGKYFDPSMDIEQWSEKIRGLQPGHALLGLYAGPMDTLCCALCWNAGGGLKQKTVSSTPNLLDKLRAALLNLTIAGISEHQQSEWEYLQETLESVLTEALEDAVHEAKLHLAVLAPGTLRALPILGLRVNGVPLDECCASVTHLMALGANSRPLAMKPTGPSKTACWLAPCDPAEGETRFGEAAIATLRALSSPVAVLDIRDREAPIPLVDLLRNGVHIEHLRIYGLEPTMRDTATATGVYCGRGHVLPAIQFSAPLVHCKLAEVWAATSGWSELEFITRDDGDRIPGMAGALLAHGASEVLDLAWAVPDMVKALVCERYTYYRELVDDHPATILALAIGQTRALLNSWREQRFDSWADAIAWLDAERQKLVACTPVGSESFVGFAAAKIEAPSDLAAFIANMTCPVHLAAFRFWC